METQQQKEADERKKMIDEIYGYTGEDEKKKDDKISDILQKFMEYRKQKQQPQLKHIFG
jgi:hypothetical protein